MSFTRPTALADAFMTATAKALRQGMIDPDKGKGNWIARRCAIDAQQERKIGLVHEMDKRPIKNK